MKLNHGPPAKQADGEAENIILAAKPLITALCMTQCLEKLSKENPKLAATFLQGAWQRIERRLASLETGPIHEQVAVVLMHEYFSHEGDWQAMQKCLSKSLDALGIKVDVMHASAHELNVANQDAAN